MKLSRLSGLGQSRLPWGCRIISFLPLIVGIVLRVIWVISVDTEPYSDAGEYHRLAAGIAQGSGYVSETCKPTAYRPVGYPAFLGLLYKVFGEYYSIPRFANVILSILVLLLTYHYARTVFTDERISLIAVTILALFPNQIVYNSLLLSEILAQFLFLALIFFGKRSPIIAGITFGLLLYVKPICLFIPLIFIIIALISKSNIWISLKNIAFLYLIALVMLAPWFYRNYQLFGEPVFMTTNVGINFWIGNNPDATGEYQDVTVPSEHSSLNEAQEDRIWSGKALTYIQQHPFRDLKLFAVKIYKIWYSDADGYSANILGRDNRWRDAEGVRFTASEWMVKWLFQAFYIAIMLFALWGFVRAWRESYYDVLYIIILTLLQAVFLGMPRFHFIMMPIIVIYSAYSLNYFISKRTKCPEK